MWWLSAFGKTNIHDAYNDCDDYDDTTMTITTIVIKNETKKKQSNAIQAMRQNYQIKTATITYDVVFA